MLASWNNGSPTPEFNNAAQSWNHEFYWESMTPTKQGAPLPPHWGAESQLGSPTMSTYRLG